MSDAITRREKFLKKILEKVGGAGGGTGGGGGSVPVMWYATNNRVYSDEELTKEINDGISEEWVTHLFNGNIVVLFDTDNDWTAYIITGIVTTGGGYSEVYVGTRGPFYTGGFDPNAEG